MGTVPLCRGPWSSPTPLSLREGKKERGWRGVLFSGLGPQALCPAPFASQSTTKHQPHSRRGLGCHDDEHNGLGVKSPASQALVHYPLYSALAPHSPGTLKSAWTPGSWPFPFPSLSSPPARECKVMDKVPTRGLSSAAESCEV